MTVQVEESYLNHLIYVSEHDELTGVLNRYGGSKRLDEIFSPYGEGFLCIVDIDHFKKINDVAGHVVGDNILKDFANCLCGVANSFVVRMGGDEFFFYVGGIDSKEVLVDEFKLLRDRVEAIDYPELGGMKVTFSLGAYYYKGGLDDVKANAYSMADGLCYDSKKHEGCSWTIK